MPNLNENVSPDLRRSFDIIVGVLLSVSLATLLIILVEKIPTIKAFIFDTIIITIIYVGIMYSIIFFKLEKRHFLFPRTLVVVLVAMLPYMVSRTYMVGIEKLTTQGLTIYLLVLFIGGLIWGLWESISENGIKSFKFLKDPRIIIFGIFLIISIVMLVNNGAIST